MNVKRGEVYFVNFDQTATRSIEKCRPGVIVQNDAGNLHSAYTIVAAIKNTDGKTLPILVEIPKGEGGLKKNSTADCGQIHTVRIDELLEYCGFLPNHRMAQVDQALGIWPQFVRRLALSRRRPARKAERKASAKSGFHPQPVALQGRASVACAQELKR